MQRNWIGKSVGADVTFEVAGTDKSFEIFTTRPDTLFGATYAVLAPEHDLVDAITTPEQKEAVAEYRRKASLKSDLARTDAHWFTNNRITPAFRSSVWKHFFISNSRSEFFNPVNSYFCFIS